MASHDVVSKFCLGRKPGWDAEGKVRFCITTVAAELGMEEVTVEEKMGQLYKLVWAQLRLHADPAACGHSWGALRSSWTELTRGLLSSSTGNH
jgi:hypothetical protein